ncbi:MAG: hypothetical protein QNJ57_11650 [Flavobacteriaceae bacterium]|nr:hypothetical protein [Flavobacteriaceae bacterium]
MEKLACICISVLWLSTMQLYSQVNDSLNASSYDFWLGEWNLSWDLPDGKKGKGVNKIVKILDDKVIQENFEDLQSGFKGMSLSVYNPNRKIWKQSWADNSGGYYSFDGAIEIDGKKVFKTKTVERNDKKIIQRMVFEDIQKDSFTWDWQGTADGGKTWKSLWRIYYRRKK